jgi:hypothetical protein
MPIFTKIRPIEAELSMEKHGRKAVRRTIITKLRVAFRNFTKGSKHQTLKSHILKSPFGPEPFMKGIYNPWSKNICILHLLVYTKSNH